MYHCAAVWLVLTIKEMAFLPVIISLEYSGSKKNNHVQNRLTIVKIDTAQKHVDEVFYFYIITRVADPSVFVNTMLCVNVFLCFPYISVLVLFVTFFFLAEHGDTDKLLSKTADNALVV